ncbi:Uncharacterized protein TCM_001254 [Theobroma cacao]|uniref:Uncharacterized protein n=1 Tax=Theobroma cacao TaxID=3641 RepID=A0A061DJ19_THECC|nr:Uncharacterized protein TCM_001254 [Theobroma cacao]
MLCLENILFMSNNGFNRIKKVILGPNQSINLSLLAGSTSLGAVSEGQDRVKPLRGQTAYPLARFMSGVGWGRPCSLGWLLLSTIFHFFIPTQRV